MPLKPILRSQRVFSAARRGSSHSGLIAIRFLDSDNRIVPSSAAGAAAFLASHPEIDAEVFRGGVRPVDAGHALIAYARWQATMAATRTVSTAPATAP